MKRWLAAVLPLAALGCDPGAASEGGEAVARVDSVGGVERVTYAAAPAGALGWSADTLFTLGDALADDAYQFDQVTPAGLAGDADGSLYLLDRQGGRVLKYGPDGEHAATYGRKGGGPGELSQPLGLALGPGDTVWVTEFGVGGAGRLTGFPQDGGEPRVVSYTEQLGFPYPELAVLERGIYQRFRPMFGGPAGRRPPGALPGAARRGDGGGEEAPQRLPLLRLDPQLEPQDTIWSLPEPPTDLVQIEMGSRMMVMMSPRQYAPAFQWRVLSDGAVVLSDSAAYLLRLLDPAGGVERLVEREPAPRAVTEADREAARERLRSEDAGGGGVRVGGGRGPDADTRRRILEQRLEKMTFAEMVPRIVSLRVDPLDRIWVGVSEETAGEIERIDLYDRDGRLMGEMRGLPMPDVFIGQDRIGVLGRDELDVQQVTVVRLSPRPRS